MQTTTKNTWTKFRAVAGSKLAKNFVWVVPFVVPQCA